MIEKKYLAVIPARKGSKGLPNKNIYPFEGKPLFLHSIDHALQCKNVSNVVLWTDSREYAMLLAETAGITDVGLRDRFASDLSEDRSFLADLIDRCDSAGIEVDAFVLLRPTTPKRPERVIDKAIALMDKYWDEYDSLRSVIVSETSPIKMWQGWEIEPGVLIGDPVASKLTGIRDAHSMPRQLLPRFWEQDGIVDVIKRSTILSGSASGDRVLLYEHKCTDRKTDIDSIKDLEKI